MFKRLSDRVLSSWRGGIFTGIGAVMGCGGVVYLLRHPLRSDTVHQTADVASEALSDIRLRQQAIVLSKEVVNNILRNDESLNLLKDLLLRLLQQEETRNGLMMLLHGVFEDPYFQETTKKFVVRILSDAWIMERLTQMTHELGGDLLANETTKSQMVEFLQSTAGTAIESQEVKEKAMSTGREIVWGVFWK